MGLALFVARGALVPRPETELLGEIVAAELRAGERMIDMCCGSGNLACGIAARIPRLRVWASDLSEGAISVARRNVEELGLGDRVSVLQGDLFAPLSGLGLFGSIDAVVCNPPYISSGRLARDRAPLLDHEPREAFDGGPYGVAIYQRVIREAPSYLRPGGVLAFEIGLAQERQVMLLLGRSDHFAPPVTRKDDAGNVRVVMAARAREA